jgi:release factor glutamine methyltransferase
VLIPRPETEELVHWILKDSLPEKPSIIDLGTGSGCIAIALKDQIKDAKVFGADVSVAALNIANENADLNKMEVDFFLFDILQRESLGFMQFDLMVSNPPYVRKSEEAMMAPNVLAHEPHTALFVPDEDPLIFYRKIADLAKGQLNPSGKLYFEINEAFGDEMVQMLSEKGFTSVELKKDFNGKDRMIRATKP